MRQFVNRVGRLKRIKERFPTGLLGSSHNYFLEKLVVVLLFL